MTRTSLSQNNTSGGGKNALPPRPLIPLTQTGYMQRKSCACGGGCPQCTAGTVQLKSKLPVSKESDPAERQADQIADQVVNAKTEPATINKAGPISTSGKPMIFRSPDDKAANNKPPEGDVLTEERLEDPDFRTRLRSMSLDELIRYRATLSRSDPGGLAYLNAMIESMTEHRVAALTGAYLGAMSDDKESRALNVSPDVRQQFSSLEKEGTIKNNDASGQSVDVELHPTLRAALWALAQKAKQRSAGLPKNAPFDMQIASMVRRGKQGLHSEGRAVDLSAYGGNALDMRFPDQAFNGVMMLIQDLPPGVYALGLPRLLDRSDGPQSGADYLRHQEQRKEYLPQEREGSSLDFSPRSATPSMGLATRANPFIDEKNKPNVPPPGGTLQAELKSIADPQARAALEKVIMNAASNGVTITHIFPDGPDHVHLSVASTAAELNAAL